ncbi:MAG: hypothetical protein K0R34_3296 [Herbinix sp.]|jgi:hypothetical protein|nr:hypothetical protein [Herbinix sp.]
MSYHEISKWNAIDRLIAEHEKSEENKTLPLGITKFNAKDAKNVYIPVFKANANK